jgi:hypothetical protein
MTSSAQNNDPADHSLYRLYWRLCLSDILFHLGFEPTKEAKLLLHDFHKRVLGYETISGRTQEVVSRFIAEMTVFWAERGIFVRTSGKQPLYIEEMGFSDMVLVGGKYVRVYDLL